MSSSTTKSITAILGSSITAIVIAVMASKSNMRCVFQIGSCDNDSPGVTSASEPPVKPTASNAGEEQEVLRLKNYKTVKK
jgi:hypothetical protein